MKVSIAFDPNNAADVVSANAFFHTIAGSYPTPASTSTPVVEQHAEPAAPTGTTDPQVGVELDKNGTPWLADVHASTKSKKADGTWTRRKGVQEATQLAAEKEARDKLAATPVAPVLPAVQPEAAPVATTAVIPTSTPVSYEEMSAKYADLSANNLINAETMMGIYTKLGVDPKELTTNETARAAVFAEMVKLETPPAATGGMPGL